MADSEVRQKFEAFAKLELGKYPSLYDLPDPFKIGPEDEYFEDAVRFAWAAFSAGMRAGEIARTERSDKDYAIEHAEYLAKAVEHYQRKKNSFAEFMETADTDRDEEYIDQLRSELSEAWRGMTAGIYEFRKRAKRALPAAPEEKKP